MYKSDINFEVLKGQLLRVDRIAGKVVFLEPVDITAKKIYLGPQWKPKQPKPPKPKKK